MIVAYAEGGSSLFCISQRGVITFLVSIKGASCVFVRCFAGIYRPPSGRNNEWSLRIEGARGGAELMVMNDKYGM